MKWGKAWVTPRVIAKIYVAWLTVAPIIYGILFPMSYFVITFVLFYFFSWAFADPILFRGQMIGSSWLAAYWGFPLRGLPLVVLEVAFFAVGLLLFCISLVVMVRGLLSKSRLVQKGPYRYIRHPQHLGLILIFLPLALYIPGTQDLGIRFGDLVSWVQFVFLLVAFSDWEDFHLRKKFPDSYPEYYAKTGFLMPKIFPSKGLGYFSIFRHIKTRYVLLILLYVLVVAELYVLYLIGPSG